MLSKFADKSALKSSIFSIKAGFERSLIDIRQIGLMLFLLLFFTSPLLAEEQYLKNNLRQARPGDYLVAMQGKSITLLHIFAANGPLMTIEEVTIPQARVRRNVSNWREWFEHGAPGNTSWVMYRIHADSGEMFSCYSFTKHSFCQISQAENFLGTLLNLTLYPVAHEYRRRIGSFSSKRYWEPQMVVDGVIVEGVPFEAYYTQWPKDGGPLSGKKIEMYLPQNCDSYCGYFPYWLQISGNLVKAKIRVIDSGSNLVSPKPGIP